MVTKTTFYLSILVIAGIWVSLCYFIGGQLLFAGGLGLLAFLLLFKEWFVQKNEIRKDLHAFAEVYDSVASSKHKNSTMQKQRNVMDSESQRRGLLELIELLLPLPAQKDAKSELMQALEEEQPADADSWEIFIDHLQEFGYSWEIPWHASPEDVESGLSDLLKTYGYATNASLPKITLTQKENAYEALQQYAVHLKTFGVLICALYEDSDYGIVVLLPIEKYAQAKIAADQTGQGLSPFIYDQPAHE